jgi:nitroimidazol reductase NimA-like FMN-containing flavoprotein (pyridoxamine 5'-phosphate oxidase superfamily)
MEPVDIGMDDTTDTADLVAMARDVIDTNPYLVLGTVDADGAPRVSPVFFGVDEYRDFYWVSSPEAVHSVNVAARPAVRAVIFDSTVQVGHARAVYLTGRARRVPDEELDTRCRVAFRDIAAGRAFGPEDLSGSSSMRLYLLPVDVCEVLVMGRDPRRGTGVDRRVRVNVEA